MKRDGYDPAVPLTAVIIPVYNDEQYLRTCLDSIKNQSAPFWEAWVVDDGSNDGSIEIVQEYCAADSRFHLLRNETNSSAWVSRAKGILAVSPTVKYIMFADADDSCQPHAVERAYQLMEEDPVDILHFGTNVENYANIARKRIRDYTAYLQPPLVKLEGRAIFDSFIERNFEGHLWNKMFRADLLREVIETFGADRFLPKAQDKVLYWAVCWQRENLTYRGVPERLYNYRYGLGVEGNSDTITLERYRQYLSQAWSEDTIAEMMAMHPQEAQKYAETLDDSRSNLIRHTARALSKLSSINRTAGLDLFSDYWHDPLDGARFAGALAEFTWENQIELADAASSTEIFRTTKKDADIHTVGTYYHRMDNGGIQRVIAQVCPVWHQLGYRIVIFSDYEPGENDYIVPEYVERVAIGSSLSRSQRGKYARRGRSIAELLREYEIDCMVYHAYFSDVLLYDMLVCKSMNVPFIIYEHNVFSRFARYSDIKFATIPLFARLAEGLVCLDDTSAAWWRSFNKNVHMVLNPLTFDLADVIPAERDNHNILFLCRLEEESKHPHDAITIIRDLSKRIPDVKLYIVGSGSEKYMASLYARIAKLELENYIEMVGFTQEVEEYYRRCSVFLSCSSHEGAPMTLCEALSFSLPIVMYDLPYLTVAQNNPGIISVKQRDTDAAVEALYNLLSDPEHLRIAGNAGRNYLEKMYSVELDRQWESVFKMINAPATYIVPDSQMMCEVLVRDYYDGAVQVNSLKGELKKMRGEIRNLRSSLSFKIGRVVTFLPRKMRDMAKKLKEKIKIRGKR